MHPLACGSPSCKAHAAHAMLAVGTEGYGRLHKIAAFQQEDFADLVSVNGAAGEVL